MVASDIADLRPYNTWRRRFVAEDAKELAVADIAGTDALVTSPPYLNGTNYFRNTKVELWFLRRLHTRENLSRFRYPVITAGINDVTIAKAEARRGVFMNDKVRQVVDCLERSAMKARPPVGRHLLAVIYFWPSKVACRTCKMAHFSRSILAILAMGTCMSPQMTCSPKSSTGMRCHLEDRVVLRERLSRGGHPLRQTLQIFPPCRTLRLLLGPSWYVRAADMSGAASGICSREHARQRGEMARRNWGHPLHSLCSYQGKLKPAIAHLLVDRIRTPRCAHAGPVYGIGTIPLEAALSDRTAPRFRYQSALVCKLLGPSSRPATPLIAKRFHRRAGRSARQVPPDRNASAARRCYPLQRTSRRILQPGDAARGDRRPRIFAAASAGDASRVDDLFVVAAYPARQPALCAEPHVTPYYTICPLRAEHISGASATAPGEGWPELGARSRAAFNIRGWLTEARHALA